MRTFQAEQGIEEPAIPADKKGNENPDLKYLKGYLKKYVLEWKEFKDIFYKKLKTYTVMEQRSFGRHLKKHFKEASIEIGLLPKHSSAYMNKDKGRNLKRRVKQDV